MYQTAEIEKAPRIHSISHLLPSTPPQFNMVPSFFSSERRVLVA